MTSATDELRRLLDERGVKWSRPSGLISSFADSITFIGDVAVVSEIDGSDLLRINFDGTPEQAIEATLGRDGYSYEQWREISNAVGDAMEYAHDKAIECPDKADPLWNLDEYVNRILKVAFEGEATLGRGACKNLANHKGRVEFVCSECGAHYLGFKFKHCPNCGRRVRA